MNCAHATRLLDAWIDDELDARTAGDMGLHVRDCTDCSKLLQRRTQGRAVLRRQAPRWQAPETLRRAVVGEIESHAPGQRGQDTVLSRRGPGTLAATLRWRLGGALGVALAIALASGVAGYRLAQPPSPVADDTLVIASHVASLAEGARLIDVASTERHVVKPWFQGRVDFSPPVRDLSQHGYTLAGARLEQLGERPASAIVYRLRSHVITLYTWRDDERVLAPPRIRTTRGFSRASWSDAGLRHEAVSDVNPTDIERFAALMSSP